MRHGPPTGCPALLYRNPHRWCLTRPRGRGQVVPGARVPADGVVAEGRSHVDESMVTGESAPVTKRPGDAVIGGTVNNGAPLVVKACPRPPARLLPC